MSRDWDAMDEGYQSDGNYQMSDYDMSSGDESDEDEPIEYAYPTSYRTLASCHYNEPANLFNPWSDMAGEKALTWGDVDERDEGCLFDPSDSYFHLSCASRRADIAENGLMVNSTALTDVGDSLTGKLFFMSNWFADPEFRNNHNMRAVRHHYKSIACMVRYNCVNKEDSEMDLWLVYDTERVIKPHSSEGLATSGEFESTRGIPATRCFLVPNYLVPPELNPSEDECEEVWVRPVAMGVSRSTKRRNKHKRCSKHKRYSKHKRCSKHKRYSKHRRGTEGKRRSGRFKERRKSRKR